MSATLCACAFPQPPNQSGATFPDEIGDPLGPAAGAINLVMMIGLAVLVVVLVRDVLRLVA
jgi:hypothetical protein